MINIAKVTKAFQNMHRPALNAIDLALLPGDFCVIIGQNGCGKSTLLKLINGEYSPDDGEVKISGKVAQVVQDVNLGTIPDMTLLENIALMLIQKPKMSFYRRYRADIMHKLQALGMGLEQYIDQPLKVLSGGQRQMVATLMATNTDSQILLLDEHTAALDPKTQGLLMEYTARQVANKKLTTLMITHKIEDAIQYGNRLIMLHQGKIVLDVEGAKKQSLRVADVLSLFHKYASDII